MVVQHILAVRKGTREISNLNKDDMNLPNDSESEIIKENEEIKKEVTEEKSDKIVDDDEMSEKKENKFDEQSDIKTDDISGNVKKEQEEPEKNEEAKETLSETEDSSKKTIEIDEYYVKYRNFSYLHCEWKTEEELMKGDKRIAAKLKRFKQKMANNTNIFENVSYLFRIMDKRLYLIFKLYFSLKKNRSIQITLK